MRKKLLGYFLIITICIMNSQNIEASVRAGCCDIKLDGIEYRNPTQYMFNKYINWDNIEEQIKQEELSLNYDSNTYEDWEIQFMKKCVLAEAGYDLSDEAVRLITDTILNQKEHIDYPNTIYDVITEPYHYSTYWSGAIYKDIPMSEQVNRIVDEELVNRYNTEVLFFTMGYYNPYCIPWKVVDDVYFGY